MTNDLVYYAGAWALLLVFCACVWLVDRREQ